METKKKSKTPLKDKVNEELDKGMKRAEDFAESITDLCEKTARVEERWRETHPKATEEEKHIHLVAALHSAILITLINV